MVSQYTLHVFRGAERVSRLAVFAFVLLSVLAIPSLRAQLMINKGATIVTKVGSFMQVNGAYQNQTGSIDDSGIVTITTDFTNNSAATAGGSGWYNIGGNYTNDGTFVRKTGTVNLNGASNQNVGGAVTTTFYDLQFTNGGSKTLTKKEIVDSNCYFTNGVCNTTQTNVLNFTTNGNWVNNSGMPTASCLSYVEGPCEKDMNSTNLFWFPVGNVGRANTCAITPSSSTPTTFRTRYFYQKYVNTVDMQLPLQSVSKIHYWHGDIVSGGADAIMRLYWIPGDYTASIYMSTMSNLVVGRWDTLAPASPGPTPAWMTAGVNALSPGATYNSGWIESATVTAIKYGTSLTNRPFTLASITADNSLPVEMGKFTARQVSNSVQLDWKTYSEIQNLGFEILRHRDGQEPVMLKSYENDPELEAKSPYGATYETRDDEGLAAGRYTYDLYQIDQNGIRTHAGSQTIDFSAVSIPSILAVSIYPNPTVEIAHIDFSLPTDAHVTAAIYDISGRLVDQLIDDNFSSGEHVISYNASRLASGTYSVVLLSDGKRMMRSFVVSR